MDKIFKKGETNINEDYIELIKDEKRKSELKHKESNLIDFYTNNHSKINMSKPNILK